MGNAHSLKLLRFKRVGPIPFNFRLLVVTKSRRRGEQIGPAAVESIVPIDLSDSRLNRQAQAVLVGNRFTDSLEVRLRRPQNPDHARVSANSVGGWPRWNSGKGD